MFLTCQQCEAQYRLNPELLGGGRMVRCTACGNIWFQEPEEGAAPALPPEIDLLDQIAEVAPPAPENETMSTKDFRQMLKQSSGDIPDVVKPSGGFQMPVMEYRPMGMGAGQFGLFTFLLLVFASSIFLFAVRAPLVKTFPVMASVYKVLGFKVRAPGEGLRLSEMIAENRIDGDSSVLAVEAKLANISERDMDYPKLVVSLKSAYGRTLQDWSYQPEKKQRLVSGEFIPVKMEFKDPHKDGKTVEMKVAE